MSTILIVLVVLLLLQGGGGWGILLVGAVALETAARRAPLPL